MTFLFLVKHEAFLKDTVIQQTSKMQEQLTSSMIFHTESETRSSTTKLFSSTTNLPLASNFSCGAANLQLGFIGLHSRQGDFRVRILVLFLIVYYQSPLNLVSYSLKLINTFNALLNNFLKIN